MGGRSMDVLCVIIFVLFTKCDAVKFFNDTNGKFVDDLNTFNERYDGQRIPRLLTFNTEENGDVEVELEFRVPFLHIPVKRAMETATGWGQGLYGVPPSANVNVGALVLGGAIIFGAAVVIPAFATFLTKKSSLFGIGGMHGPEGERSERRSDREDDLSRMMKVIEKILSENNIDTSVCIQRAMCRITKKATTKLKNGNPHSYDLLITGLARNNIFNNLIQNTYFHTAINSGLDNNNCLTKYKDCKITQKTIHKLVNKFSTLMNYNIF